EVDYAPVCDLRHRDLCEVGEGREVVEGCGQARARFREKSEAAFRKLGTNARAELHLVQPRAVECLSTLLRDQEHERPVFGGEFPALREAESQRADSSTVQLEGKRRPRPALLRVRR